MKTVDVLFQQKIDLCMLPFCRWEIKYFTMTYTRRWNGLSTIEYL